MSRVIVRLRRAAAAVAQLELRLRWIISLGMRRNDESQNNEPQAVDRHAHIFSDASAWAAFPEAAIRPVRGLDWYRDYFYGPLMVSARPRCHKQFTIESYHRRSGRTICLQGRFCRIEL